MEKQNEKPTIVEAENWPIVMRHFQTDNNCELTIRAESPDTKVPAYPDFSKIELLEKKGGNPSQILMQLHDGTVFLFSYNYNHLGKAA